MKRLALAVLFLNLALSSVSFAAFDCRGSLYDANEWLRGGVQLNRADIRRDDAGEGCRLETQGQTRSIPASPRDELQFLQVLH